MSRENVELVREGIGLLNAHDLEGVLEFVDPACEYRPAIEGEIEGGGAVYRGHDGFRRWWREMEEQWSEWSVELHDVRDLGDRVLLLGVARFRGRRSGVPVESPLADVITLRRGLVIRQEDFATREKALEAVGLSE